MTRIALPEVELIYTQKGILKARFTEKFLYGKEDLEFVLTDLLSIKYPRATNFGFKEPMDIQEAMRYTIEVLLKLKDTKDIRFETLQGWVYEPMSL